MFIKPYRVKSESTLKSSDRKKLLQKLCDSFGGNVKPGDIGNGTMTMAKVFCHKGELVNIYNMDGIPLCFDFEDRLYPTLSTLWRFPGLILYVTAVSNVVEFLQNGASLMLPGVLSTPEALSSIQEDDVVAIRVPGNKAAVAVGRAEFSGADMVERGMRGKGIAVYHVYMDSLWAASGKQEMSIIPYSPSDQVRLLPDPDSPEPPSSGDTAAADLAQLELAGSAASSEESSDEEEECQDDIFHATFLQAIKTGRLKKADVPMLASKLMGVYLIPSAPPHTELNIKRTTWKKFSAFLRHLRDSGLLTIDESAKGCDTISGINWLHADIRSHDAWEIPVAAEAPKSFNLDSYVAPQIGELYAVPNNLVPILPGYARGAVGIAADFRNSLTQYVKEHELADQGAVKMDYVLASALSCKDPVMKYPELFNKLFSKLSPVYKIMMNGREEIRAGRPKPIVIAVKSVRGNKHITLIQNLEAYGIEPTQFAEKMQKKFAASATMSEHLGRPAVQLQGTRDYDLQKYFVDTLKLHPRYLKLPDTAGGDKKKGGGRGRGKK